MPERVPGHYATLNLKPDASDAEVKRRYRQLMREVHPDANKDDPAATRKAARVNGAYEILGDSKKRRAYDVEHSVGRSVPLTQQQRNKRYEHFSDSPERDCL